MTSENSGSVIAEATTEPVASTSRPATELSWKERAMLRTGPILLTLLSTVLLIDALGSGLGSLARPGAGLWPAVSSLIALVCSLICVFLPITASEPFTRPGIAKVLIFVALLALFALTVESIGFIIPSVILLFGISRWVGAEKNITSVLVAIIGAGVSYLVFSELLGISASAF